MMIAILLFFIPVNAHAYLDLGTGSFIVQLIIAAIAGVFFSAKLYWHKIKTQFTSFLNRFFKREKNGE